MTAEPEYEFKLRGRAETDFSRAFDLLRELYGDVAPVGGGCRTSVYFDRARRLEYQHLRLRTTRRRDGNTLVMLKATLPSAGPLRVSREYSWRTGPEGLSLLDPVHRRLPVVARTLDAAFDLEERSNPAALATLVPVSRVTVVRTEFLVSSPEIPGLRLFNVLLDRVNVESLPSGQRPACVSTFVELEVEIDTEYGEAFDEAARLVDALRRAGYEPTTRDKCGP